VAKEASGDQTGVSRWRLEIEGIVQGVGFRPFVYHQATAQGLAGWVKNTAEGVVIEVEGRADALAKFARALRESPPPLSRITALRQQEVPTQGEHRFEIVASGRDSERQVLISPDVATCADCRREIFDPVDRHYRYPFTNCTNCGPRYTIIADVPYDRARTSMRPFPMCPDCAGEYQDPMDRRFHAQRNACPVCGPRVQLVDAQGQAIPNQDWLAEFRRLIKAGQIVAVKGLGGFHLACNPFGESVVQRLRARKRRPAKPFAIMCRDTAVVKRYCLLNAKEEELLTSPQAPIVILRRREGFPKAGADLAPSLAPGTATLGVMLPYTPLHLLLLGEELEALVMTSGNISELPLAASNEQALKQLVGIADYFLWHDREIVNRCDDSLLRVVENEPLPYRRSRGYVPGPLPVPELGQEVQVLGTGGEMKNAFCLLKGRWAFPGPHIGEMIYRETVDHYLEALEGMKRLYDMEPRVVAHDLHPEYRLTKLVQTWPDVKLVPVQHHHAHLAACLAENQAPEGTYVGVICDGTGYGPDGHIWGMEILLGGYRNYQRCLHLDYLPMPGGDAAARHPWRMAVSYLYKVLGNQGLSIAEALFPTRPVALISGLVKGGRCPLTASCGRLFDAVSALLGVCEENTYEGRAPVELTELAEDAIERLDGTPRYSVPVRDGIFDPHPLIAGLMADKQQGRDVGLLAAEFHRSLAAALAQAAHQVGQCAGAQGIALSGGTFQNPLLLTLVRRDLRARGWQVYYHREVPPNDGGLALGQALVARARLAAGH